MPYTTSVAGGHLHPGSVIKIKGEPTDSAHRFTVNLRNASHDNNVFHFNARFDKGELIGNSNFPSSTWGTEEKSALPFKQGEPFEMEIICLNDCYLVTVDGNYCCEFAHRSPLDQVDKIYIYGDVHIKKIKITEQDEPDTKLNVNDPAIPFTSHLGGHLSEGQELHVYGKVPESGRFRVNLQQGDGYPDSNIAFHFNPRYEGDPVVVMNTWLDSAWGAEERHDCGPLKPGQNFALIIRVKSDGYKVVVNGHKFFKFEHRVSPDIADSIEITGDITVHRLLTY